VMVIRDAPFIRDLSDGYQETTKVFKRVQNNWVEWVMVAESALLRSIGKQGWGLYALKSFCRRERIGIFGGVLQKQAQTSRVTDAALQSQAHSNDESGYSLQVRLRRPHGGGVAVINGCDGPPPFLHLINDAHRSTYTNNVRFDQHGGVEAIRNIMPVSDMQAADLIDLARSEFLVAYRQDYWRHRNRCADKQ
jgi:hypothetical protein